MCGITGFLGGRQQGAGERAALVEAMANRIRHRGPDDSGAWCEEGIPLALGHRRLAIVDLSAAGHQPMMSGEGRYVIVFNGEIYNHLDIRAELQRSGHAVQWRGHSDTETLLAGFDIWGVDATVSRAVGMFAFALWDRQARALTLGRDRLGEKPLYYGWQGSGEARAFLFGSELKALQAHPVFERRIDRDALCLFMRYNNVAGTASIYEGIQKLSPGHLLTVSLDARDPVERAYWSGAEIALQGVNQPFSGSLTQAVDALDQLLRSAIRLRLSR